MKPVDRMARAPLFDITTSRMIELALAQASTPHTLITSAGNSIAKLALAIAPNAQEIWIACGPGNNASDAMTAAIVLHRLGKSVHVTTLHNSFAQSSYMQWATDQLQEANIPIHPFDASGVPAKADLIIDGLLGVGCNRPVIGELATIVTAIRRRAFTGVPVLAIDVPTGLMADTGHANESTSVKATHTLSLITLRPGLFTAMGRELCGKVWLESLGAEEIVSTRNDIQPVATLGLSNAHRGLPTAYSKRSHASHKGQFGDVAIVGGDAGKEGAAILAAHAALKAGAGRVFLSFLSTTPDTRTSTQTSAPHHSVIPDLMVRPWTDIDLAGSTVVAGCGGDKAIASAMPTLISTCPSLVLDADALNVLATNNHWQDQLRMRHARGWSTILTPHPKEAARLLDCTVVAVQQDRLSACKQLANRYLATVLLKGSGTIIASPNTTPVINQTGNGRLAVAGTGDVLAGMIGTGLAQLSHPQRAAEQACYWHGLIAMQWPNHQSLTASELIDRLPGV